MKYDLRTVLDLIYGKDVRFAYKRPLLLRATARQAAEIESKFHDLMKRLSMEFFYNITSEFEKQLGDSEVLAVQSDKPEQILCLLVKHHVLDTAKLGNVDIEDLKKGSQTGFSTKFLRNTYNFLLSVGPQILSNEELEAIVKSMKTLLAFAESLSTADFFSKFIGPNLTKQTSIVLYPNVEGIIRDDPWNEVKLEELTKEWGSQVRDVVGFFINCKNLRCLSLTECMNKFIPSQRMEEIKLSWLVKKKKEVFSVLREHPLLYSSFLISFFSDAWMFLNESKELFHQAGKMANIVEARTKWVNAIVNAGTCLETLLTILYFVTRKHAPLKEYTIGDFLAELENDVKSFGRETLSDLNFVKELRNKCAHYRAYDDLSGATEIDEIKTLMALSRAEMFFGIMKSYLRESIHETYRGYLP